MSEQALSAVLARFHRDVLLPDIEHVVSALVAPRFDAIDAAFAQRLDSLEAEVESLAVSHRQLATAVYGIEERLGRIEKRLDDLLALQHHYALKADVQLLRARLDAVEAQLDALRSRFQP